MTLATTKSILIFLAASADAIAKLVCKTASLADGVSEKVKQLDLAKSRVSNTQQRVHDLIDLRLCRYDR